LIFGNLPNHNKVREALPKVNGVKIPEPEAKIVNSNDYNLYGDAPDVTFADLIKYRDCTPQIYIAISSYRDLIAGTNLEINSDDEDSKKLIEDWIRNTGFFDKWIGLVETTLTCGTSLLEKLDESQIIDVLEVDMKTIVGKKRDDYGFTKYYIQQLKDGKTKPLSNLKKYIEFSLTNSSRSIWGKSLFYSLAVARTVGDRTTRPLVEQLWALEDAITQIPINHAYPKEYHIFPNADQTKLDKQAIKIKKWKPGDKWVGTQMPEVQILETKGDSKYTDYINYFGKTIELGTQFPHDIMTGDFTSRAASDTTDNLVMKRVKGFTRYMLNKIKIELFDEILRQSGKDPNKVNLQVSAAVPDILVLTIEQVANLYRDKAITLDEFREYIKNKKALDLFDTIEQPEPDDEFDQTKFQQDTISKFKNMEKRAKQIKKEFKEENEVTESELRKTRKKILKKLAEKEGIDIT
jgi:hypothetical protein